LQRLDEIKIQLEKEQRYTKTREVLLEDAKDNIKNDENCKACV